MESQLENRLFTFAQMYADDYPEDADMLMKAEHALTNARLLINKVDNLFQGRITGTTPQEIAVIAEIRQEIKMWRLTWVNMKEI